MRKRRNNPRQGSLFHVQPHLSKDQRKRGLEWTTKIKQTIAEAQKPPSNEES